MSATPESLIAALDRAVPIALLPVRIETRFLNDATELRVRIYPEPLHIDTHEPELTDEEATAGRRYWTERWASPTDSAVPATQWKELVRAFQPRRALWVVHSSTPVNVAQLGGPAPPEFPAVASRPSAWTRAAYAALMPGRWLAIGLQDGVEIFRKWGVPLPDRLPVGPDPNEDDEIPEPSDAVAFDEGIRWLADYEQAVALGMGITITDAEAEGPGLGAGLDQLIVLGVDTDLSPEESGAALAASLRAHVYTDGLSIVPPGSPTNNTEAGRTGDPHPDEALARELDPALPRALDPVSGGRMLERALGLEADSAHLVRAPRAELAEQRTASLLIDVLWRTTLGYFLDQLLDPLVDDATVDRLREYARTFLQPGGPLPVVRSGKQPYGVLPIMAPVPSRSVTPGEIRSELTATLEKLRPFWESASHSVPRLETSADPDTALLGILQMTPLAATARFRRIIGPELEPNTQGLRTHALAQQYYASLITQLALGWRTPPRVASFTADPRAHPLRVPWVQKDPVDGLPLEPNYLAEISRATRATGGRALLDERKGRVTLLDALTTNAALNEIDAAGSRVVTSHQIKIGALAEAPARNAFRMPETVRILGGSDPVATPGVPGPVRIETPRELNDLVLPEMTGRATVGDWIAARIRAGGSVAPPQLGDLLAFLDGLDELATRPAGEIDRALRGVLDCYSHRLDAWYTSLATAQLEELRGKRPLGVHVGGYGWVEGLRPDVAPDSLGYVHAPSIEQASAAAILRSGHLAHRDGQHETMNIDLRSDRVRLALGILEGVAQGQPLAAILGYRIERALRDRDPRLARFIAPLRRFAPLRPVSDDPQAEPAEAIAARDVVDGVELLDRWRRDGRAVLNSLSPSAPTEAEGQAVVVELNRLADTLDAVSDLLVAESVYQTTAGNPERARAALAVLDRQERPVDAQVVRTPRTGATYAQRLMVLLTSDAAPATWSTLVDVRAAAEPRLSSWMGGLIGNPSRIRIAGQILTDNKPPRAVTMTLRQLLISPLSLVMAARRGGPEQPSELEERVAAFFAGRILSDDVNPRLVVDAEPPAGNMKQVGLGRLLTLLEWIGALTGQRAADARDFALGEDDVAAGIDAEDLGARADAAVAAFDTALLAIETAVRARTPAERTLRTALTRAAAAGAQHAIPPAIVRDVGGDPAGIIAVLIGFAAGVIERMRVTRATLDSLDSGLAAAPQPLDSTALAAHHIARIRAIFGSDLPVIPRFTVPNVEALSASLVEQDALCVGDRLAPSGWLQRMALVRPDVDALQRIFTGTELLGGVVNAADLRIVQLPHVPGQRWAALPQAPGVTMTADVALTVHAPGKLDFASPLAGIVCDDWVEIVPAAVETTGLSFHYDAPGARAPNTILLAVPSPQAGPRWSVEELVGVVREASSLAKMRLVGPRQLHALGTLLPTIYLPDNFRRDVPSVDMLGLTRGVMSTSAILGKSL